MSHAPRSRFRHTLHARSISLALGYRPPPLNREDRNVKEIIALTSLERPCPPSSSGPVSARQPSIGATFGHKFRARGNIRTCQDQRGQCEAQSVGPQNVEVQHESVPPGSIIFSKTWSCCCDGGDAWTMGCCSQRKRDGASMTGLRLVLSAFLVAGTAIDIRYRLRTPISPMRQPNRRRAGATCSISTCPPQRPSRSRW
jgi:hypothetical protein